MDKLIKIWLIVIITTISAILLPSIAFGVEDNDFDIVETYKGVKFKRPLPTLQYEVKKDDGTIISKRQSMYAGSLDSNTTCGSWVMTRVYSESDNETYVTVRQIFYNSATDTYLGSGNLTCLVIRKGNIPLKDIVISTTNISLYKDLGNISNCDSNYDGTWLSDYMNKDVTDGVINTEGLIFNPDTDEWLSDDIKYDLEIVEGVSINISANVKDEYIIKWKPSNDLQNKEYYRNLKLEIYQVLNGRAKDKIWDSWQEFYFEPYLYETPYAYKEIWQGNLEGTEESEQLVGQFLDDDSGFICEYYSSDFVLRYRYLDDNNILHYSKDFVYIQCTSDGTYTISIPDTDDVDDIVPDIPTKENDIYTDEIRTEDDEDIEVTNIFNTIKSLFNTMKEFPDYFGKIFTMFPTWVITLISFGIGAIIIIGLLKAIL